MPGILPPEGQVAANLHTFLKIIAMLTQSKAFSSFSVDDLEAAKKFYGQTLALNVREDKMGLLEIDADGGTKIMIYPKPDHLPATFTVLNFPVDHIETSVAELKKMGVVFESYDMKDLKTDENNIARGGGGPNIAWFKDPAGNILSVLEKGS